MAKLKPKLKAENFSGKKTFKEGEVLTADHFLIDKDGKIIVNEKKLGELIKSQITDANRSAKKEVEVSVSVKIKK